MKKLLVIMLLQTFCLAMFSQTKSEESRVVDAVSGEPLPYAGVYVSPELGTMTNDDGFFHLDVEAGRPIRISYIGYETVRATWTTEAKTYRLKPLTTDMQEITVMASENIMEKVIKRLRRDFTRKRRKKANFFYRLSNTYSGKTEMTEAFLTARSAINVRDMEFYNGRRVRQLRYSRTESNIRYSNLQQLVCLGPAIENNKFWNVALRPIYLQDKTKVPIKVNTTDYLDYNRQTGAVSSNFYHEMTNPRFFDYYNTTASKTTTAEGKEIICLNLQLRGKFQRPAMTGKLYVDAADYRVLSFEGRMQNMVMDAGVDFHSQATRAEVEVRVMYTHENGFTEVENVVCHMSAGTLKSRSILYNMNKQPLPFEETQKSEDNLARVISEAGYDSTLWNLDVVRRTVEEQQLAWFANLSPVEQQEWMLANVDTTFKSSGPFRPLVSRLHKFAETIPQEKVYIHMDNTSYMLGDTIWFKAYLRQTGTDRPSNVSGVLYVELLNHDGYMMERKQIAITDGSGHGFFALPKGEMYAGFHEIRAYTRWQLNWGCFQHKHSPIAVAGKWFPNEDFEKRFFRDYEKLYSRTFPVYDAPVVPGEFDHGMTLRVPRRSFKKDPDKRKLVLSLFPEGGTLVEGVPCRVAYEVAWNDGQWVEGNLFVDRDSFPAVDRGRGTFVYTPDGKKPKIFFRTKEGEEVSAKLPDAEKQGVSLQVIRNGDEWRILTHTTGGMYADSLALTVTHQGHVERVHTAIGSPLVIPVDSLRAGVHQVTVFNRQGRVFADRLFFSYRPADVSPTLYVSGLRNDYKPYEPISLTLQGKAEASDISLAVRDADYMDESFDNGNILTEMLLASEIKGFVPNPGFYFEAYDDAHLQALDLLMMTQGWRRFEWRHMAVRGTWDLTQPDEKAPILIGKLYDDDVYRYSYFPGGLGDDPQYIQHQIPTTIPKDVTVHAELIPLYEDEDSKEDVAYEGEVFVQERMSKNGMFRIQLPRLYYKSILHLDASNVTKWTRRRKYKWVQTKLSSEDFENMTVRQRRRFQEITPEFYVTVDFPYPRFVKPYTFHQTHLLETGGGFDPTAKTMLSDGTTRMQQITVKGKRNIWRRFSDAYPVLTIDAYEAANMAHDAGVPFVRTLVSDYGSDFPYVRSLDPNRRSYIDRIEARYAWGDHKRIIEGLSNNPDSIYSRDQLRSHHSSYMGNVSPYAAISMNSEEYIEKIVFYSDYAPRLEGSRRYWGSNLPETTLAYYPFRNEERREIYRNRRFVLPGFASCGEFYNPDYSNRTPDADHADYRRTLYWNPNVRLDKNGRAEVKFFNNTRTTTLSVEAAGQSESGALLWNAAEKK